jgi:2-keto-3-deoxy-L-rhamnonate aldolase RhmA
MAEVDGLDVLGRRLAEISESLGSIGTAFHPDLGETLDAVLRAKSELDGAREQHAGPLSALESLRAAWNAHMATCPQHAKLPSFEEIKAWMDAPSNTASGGQ